MTQLSRDGFVSSSQAPGPAQLGQKKCSHCGNPIKGNSGSFDSDYCCIGCETVHTFLKDEALDRNYYSLKRDTPSLRPCQPVTLKERDFKRLDDPDFRKEWSISDSQPCLDFFVEGVHCAACLWLVEKMPERIAGVQSARLDLSSQIARVELSPGGSFKEVADQLARFGYGPIPIRNRSESTEHQTRENRKTLVQIAVAAACAANAMILSVSLYAGATGWMGELFRWGSVLVSIPSYLYSAIPFYRSAWASLKERQISIDVPVVLALVLGFVASVVNVIRGTGEIYIDSLLSLIFLLLGSRYFLKRLQQQHLKAGAFFDFFLPSRVNVFRDGWKTLLLQEIRIGDRVQVAAQERIPVDGRVISGRSHLDLSWLTGESLPVSVEYGDLVYSGTGNQEGVLEIEVTAVGNQSRMGQLIQKLTELQEVRTPLTAKVDEFAKGFLWVALTLGAMLILFFWSTDPSEGFRRALSLLILTCPCALALATPLTLITGMKQAAKEGILIKDPSTLERLFQMNAKSDAIYFDKTGTLTTGVVQVAREVMRPSRWSPEELRARVVALEAPSSHPLAKALVRHYSGVSKLEVADWVEIPGQGVSARVNGDFFKIGKNRSSQAQVTLEDDSGVILAEFFMADQVRPEASDVVKALKSCGFRVCLLSGDRREIVEEVGRVAGIDPKDCFSDQTPDEKMARVSDSSRKNLMIGDGANDAWALSNAWVGIAVYGSLEASLKAASIYLSQSGLALVARVMELSLETKKVLYRNFFYSLTYNGIGAVLACLGHVGPLFSAIVMPVSALTVFLSSVKWIQRKRQ